MKPHRQRPQHGRLSSITFRRQVSYQRDASTVKAWRNVRLAIVAFLVTFAVYVAFHLLQHAKHGTVHQFSAARSTSKPVSDVRRYGRQQSSDSGDQYDVIAEMDTRKRIYRGLSSLNTRLSNVNGHSRSVAIDGWAIKTGDGLPLDVLAAWTAARSAVRAAAASLTLQSDVTRTSNAQPSGRGAHLPQIDVASVQAYLDCSSSRGQWAFDPLKSSIAQLDLPLATKQHSGSGSAPERLSGPSALDWHWQSAGCRRLLPETSSGANVPVSRRRLCSLLEGKQVLLIGEVPSLYKLHDLLLDYTNSNATSCYGNIYCTLHEICRFDDDTTGPAGISAENASTLLRYRRSDSLFMDPAIKHPRYAPQTIHEYTGIREINLYAIPDLRRSDVVIFSKPPIPMPLGVSADFNESINVTAITELAMRLTIDVWLPELITALDNMQPDGLVPAPILVYTSARRMSAHSSKPMEPISSGPTLSDLLTIRDARFLLYNLQTILQNEVVREVVLVERGIYFLDIDSAMSVWHTPLPRDAAFATLPEAGRSEQILLSTPLTEKTVSTQGDCLTLCLPSPGSGIETLFLGGLSAVLSSLNSYSLAPADR